MQAIYYFNCVFNALINTSIPQVYACCTLPSVNDYTSHLQHATTVELAIKQFYLLVS